MLQTGNGVVAEEMHNSFYFISRNERKGLYITLRLRFEAGRCKNPSLIALYVDFTGEVPKVVGLDAYMH